MCTRISSVHLGFVPSCRLPLGDAGCTRRMHGMLFSRISNCTAAGHTPGTKVVATISTVSFSQDWFLAVSLLCSTEYLGLSQLILLPVQASVSVQLLRLCCFTTHGSACSFSKLNESTKGSKRHSMCRGRCSLISQMCTDDSRVLQHSPKHDIPLFPYFSASVESIRLPLWLA